MSFGGSFHECSGTAFDIEGDDFGSSGDFFAQDAADDKGEAGHGGGDIAECVEGFVGGGEAWGLAGECDADFFGLGLHLVGSEVSGESRDAGKFVDGATGFSESGAGHLDDSESARGENGEEDDGGFVADTACAMFINPGTGETVEIDSVAGFGHCSGEVGGFLVGESVEVNRHEPGGKLVVGDGGLGGSVGDELQFFVCVGFLVAFGSDEVEDVHGV